MQVLLADEVPHELHDMLCVLTFSSLWQATIFDWAVFLQMNMRGYVQNASDRPAKVDTHLFIVHVPLLLTARGGQAHEFMLRWTIFTSLVIRDLTLRSAPSFGSFNLLHLMLDELVVWLAERMASEVTLS